MKLYTLVLLTLLCCLPGVVDGTQVNSGVSTALASLAASLHAGTWAELETNQINSTLKSDGGVSGVIFGYTEYIKWDPVAHRLYFLGGDHSQSGTPVMKFVQYEESSNTWSVLPSQDWFTAFATHGYDHAAIDPVHRYFYFRPPGNTTMWRYNLDNPSWTAMPRNNVIQFNSCCVGIEYFPELRGVIWVSDENVDDGGVVRLSDATGQWDRLGKGAAYPMGRYHNFAEYNPVRKVVVFGGGEGGSATRQIWKLDAKGTVTRLNKAPIDLGIQNAIFTVDPAGGDYLVLTRTQEFYVYNVVSDTWSLKTRGSSVPIWTTAYQNAIHGVVAGPISTYGVNVFVTCDGPDNCRVNLYKHS